MHPHLKANNYLLIPNFLSVGEAENLAGWMLEQESLGLLQKDPRENINLFGLATLNGLPFIKLLVKKIPEISSLCGEDVLPTYVYSIIYKHNSELIRHRDRDACEISLTVNLKKDSDWPICLKTLNGEEICMELNQGDALMYLGCRMEHWRHKQYSGQNYIQIFMHYVRADGPCAYTFFDIKK